MGRDRPSNEDAPRVPGEEGSRRRRPIIWIVLGLILLLLLALLIPFACQALRGNGDQGSGKGGSGAQGGAQKQADRGGKRDGQNAAKGGGKAGSDAGKSGNAEKGTGGQSAQGNGAQGNGATGAPRNGIDAGLAAVPDRSGDGKAVTIPEARLKGTRGWLAIHADDGGKPGAVLGHAALKEGTNNDVTVRLNRPIDSSQRLYAVVHADDPADGKYTFPNGDPPVGRNGKMAVEPLSYTLRGGASGKQAGVRNGDLPESGGVPPALFLAAATSLLLLSAAGLTLALRQGDANGN